MLGISIVLVFVGLVLIYLEFFLPGMILGIAGGVSILTAIAMFAAHSTSLIATIAFCLISGAAVWGICLFALSRIRKSHKESTFYSGQDQEGYFASEFDKTLIGHSGTVVSDLKPSGHVLVQDKRVQAISEKEYLDKGTRIQVIGGRGGYLIVKRVE